MTVRECRSARRTLDGIYVRCMKREHAEGEEHVSRLADGTYARWMPTEQVARIDAPLQRR